MIRSRNQTGIFNTKTKSTFERDLIINMVMISENMHDYNFK